ncbi:phage baseplate assembly protein V [Streptomyces goshikiensis]|uniref:phage baseplate assembly protein V n=1 Tax=Streptomyces goshikiensis TaxID=1942 RepID=UPI00364CEF8F
MIQGTSASRSDVYAAIVTHSQDPQRLGRVRLRIPQVSGSAVTGWASPSGTLLRLPAVGERVFAAFEGGGIRLVYWLAQPVTTVDEKHYAHASVHALPNLPAGTYTALPWASVAKTSDGIWSSEAPTRFYAPVPGLYKFGVNVEWTGGNSDCRIGIGLNSATAPRWQIGYVATTTGSNASGNTLPVRLEKNDYLQVLLYADAAASLPSSRCNAFFEWVGP